MKHLHTKKLFLLVSFFATLFAFSQEEITTKYTSSNKGKFYISWGGNREAYSRSDINFKGENYNFTINNASAVDKPKGWHIDYINPSRITIPQTNFKLGYFINDHYSIALGIDHMKYVLNVDDFKSISGTVNLPEQEPGSMFNGNYDGSDYFMSRYFLQFEHTNGLNYAYLEFARHDDISSFIHLPNTDKFQINITEGLGAGALYPKTNTTLLLKERYDEFHLSGYGIHFNAGLNFTFFKHFFIQGDLRAGYINMPDIRTTSNTNESASQHFWFLERVISFGTIFRV